jgi:hypothetical protein
MSLAPAQWRVTKVPKPLGRRALSSSQRYEYHVFLGHERRNTANTIKSAKWWLGIFAEDGAIVDFCGKQYANKSSTQSLTDI